MRCTLWNTTALGTHEWQHSGFGRWDFDFAPAARAQRVADRRPPQGRIPSNPENKMVKYNWNILKLWWNMKVNRQIAPVSKMYKIKFPPVVTAANSVICMICHTNPFGHICSMSMASARNLPNWEQPACCRKKSISNLLANKYWRIPLIWIALVWFGISLDHHGPSRFLLCGTGFQNRHQSFLSPILWGLNTSWLLALPLRCFLNSFIKFLFFWTRTFHCHRLV